MAGMGQLEKAGEDDVLVFPVIQAGQFDVREEEQALTMLFSHLSQQDYMTTDDHYHGPLMDLTSGYFGLYKDYRDLVLQANLRCRIIAASPKVRNEYSNSLGCLG
jgi:CDP-diacylglycerol---glycerol-3-phosphate 3-phosphatidyltransferase